MLCGVDDSGVRGGVCGSLSSLQTLKLRGKKVTPRSLFLFLSFSRARALMYISDTYAYKLGGKSPSHATTALYFLLSAPFVLALMISESFIIMHMSSVLKAAAAGGKLKGLKVCLRLCLCHKHARSESVLLL